MAKPRRKLNWQMPNLDAAKNDFAALGPAARTYLEQVLIYDDDPGKRELAREILGYTLPPQPDPEVIRNVED
jgi:hypothetical protein